MTDQNMNIEAGIRAWIEDELRLLRFTDKFRYLLTWEDTLIGKPPQVQISWTLVVSMPSGVINKSLRDTAKFTGLDPAEAAVREKVRVCVERLRQAKQQLNKQGIQENGHASGAKLIRGTG